VASVKPESYRVVLERDESGAWIARIPRVRGCHAYGRTLEQARRRIREALALWIEGADIVELVEDVRLPAEARDAIRRSRRARSAAEAQRLEAQAATAEAAQALVQELHLGVRDAGELLGLSHQRVQQLVRG
jgi:predicted RNase H-like HicB family nuclease